MRLKLILFLSHFQDQEDVIANIMCGLEDDSATEIVAHRYPSLILLFLSPFFYVMGKNILKEVSVDHVASQWAGAIANPKKAGAATYARRQV